eukprot:6147921-Pleurochrysis_carterae.AAC.1
MSRYQCEHAMTIEPASLSNMAHRRYVASKVLEKYPKTCSLYPAAMRALCVAAKESDAGVGVSSGGSSVLWTCRFCHYIKTAPAATSDASVMIYNSLGLSVPSFLTVRAPLTRRTGVGAQRLGGVLRHHLCPWGWRATTIP